MLRTYDAEASDLVRRGRRVGAIRIPKGFGDASEPAVLRRVRRRWSCASIRRGRPRRRCSRASCSSRRPSGCRRCSAIRPAAAAMVAGMLADVQKQPAGSSPGQAVAADDARLARHVPRRADEGAADARPRRSARRPARRRRRAPATAAAAGSRSTIAVTSIERQRKGPANGYQITFPQGMQWGILGCMMSFAISLAVERIARHADAAADVAGAVVGAARRQGPGLLHGDPDRRRRRWRSIGAAFFGVRPSSVGAAAAGPGRSCRSASSG